MNTVLGHVRQTIQASGLRTFRERSGPTDIDWSYWLIVAGPDFEVIELLTQKWSIRMTSPLFHFKPYSIAQVRHLLAVLQGNFKMYEPHPTYSGGWRIHVGNGNAALDFVTIQNLAAFLWAFEPEITRLHRHVFNTSYGPLRVISKLGRNPPSKPSFCMDGLTTISQMKTVEAIVELLDPEIPDAPIPYRFRGFRGPLLNGEIPAIEFRQNDLMADIDGFLAWIVTAVLFVKMARDVDRNRLWIYCVKQARQFDIDGTASINIIAFFRALRLEERALFYENRL